MNEYSQESTTYRPKGLKPSIFPNRTQPDSLTNVPKIHLSQPTIADARFASLKVLLFTLLTEIESLENRLEDADNSGINLHEQVQRFEAALIRVALSKTGGRQRRAARLLGTKVTTLNSKIRRYGLIEQAERPTNDGTNLL